MFQNDISVKKVSDLLEKRRILLCVTGSIAAVETVKLARALRRYGATVKAELTQAAKMFITPLALEWATGEVVVSEFSGRAEHVVDADLVLVAPATLNTVNKVALGLADNVVTTSIASAWGQKTPIVFIPAMHESLFSNPLFQKNGEYLKQQKNIFFLEPKFEERKAKFLEPDLIVAHVAHILNQNSKLSKKKILITAGPTRGPIDSVRFLSNFSTGELGVRLARELFYRGTSPTLIYGPGQTVPDSFYNVIHVQTPQQMMAAVQGELSTSSYDAVIYSAAVLDDVPDHVYEGKLSSLEPLEVTFTKTPKIIREIKTTALKIGFKLEWKKSRAELLKIGMQALETLGLEMVVVNNLSQIDLEHHPALILDRKTHVYEAKTKQDIIHRIIEILNGYI